jgi:glycosyltransferase involved in cell wall biosynthesis
MVDFTIIVVTHNRAPVLRRTLASLAELSGRASWDLMVVDNGSTDTTRAVVATAARTFPAAVHYRFEPTPGKYAALNAGLRAARGRFVAATDDDAFPAPDWLDCALDGFERFGCGFVGGPVFPVWEAPPPGWLAAGSSLAGKVLALQDYGSRSLEYGKGIAWPLGVNVAYRRDVFDRAGLFDRTLGRVAGTLRSQAQREWHIRARAAGITGFYLPDMIVRHSVTRDRLTKQYFRRWFYWHGVSRTILHAQTGLDLLEPDAGAAVPVERCFAGVPLPVWRRLALSGASWLRRRAGGDAAAAFEYELWIAFCSGIVREHWRRRRPRRAAISSHVCQAD